MISGIDFKKYDVLSIYDDFDCNAGACLSSQIDNLKEDMLQVTFSDEIILDVGWRPSFDINGKFYIVLVKNSDWESPLYSATACTVDAVRREIVFILEKFLE